MAVFVTGANGFLGQHVVRSLLAHGHTEIRCLVRQPAYAEVVSLLAAPWPNARVECAVGDFRSTEALEVSLRGVDTVYHLAATMKGSFSDMVMGTVVGSKYLLDACAVNCPTARIVLVSSFAVYGTAGLPAGALLDETCALETQPLKRGSYGWSKLRQERLVQDYARAMGTPLVIIRPGVVYGPGGVTFSTRIGVQLPGLFLHLGGSNIIPFTFVENCAEAIVVAGQHPDSPGAAYNVVDDDLMTSSEFLRAYRRRVQPLRYVYLPRRAMRVIAGWVEWYHRRSRGQLPPFFTRYMTDSNWKGCTFSNSRLKSLGWTPSVSTAEGMRRTFDHLRKLHEQEYSS